MFCIKCGQEAKKDNLCEQHFLEKHNLFTVEDVRVIVCECGAYRDRGWYDKLNIKEIVNRHLKTDNKITKITVAKKHVGNKYIVTVTATGKIKGIKKTEQKIMTIITKKQKCDTCVKLAGGYFVALIQIRGEDADKMIQFVKQYSKDITSVEKLKYGYNIKFMSKDPAKKAAKLLKSKGYEVKRSFKLGGTKKGVMLYRDCYSVR